MALLLLAPLSTPTLEYGTSQLEADALLREPGGRGGTSLPTGTTVHVARPPESLSSEPGPACRPGHLEGLGLAPVKVRHGTGTRTCNHAAL